jgi:hypothetical protein
MIYKNEADFTRHWADLAAAKLRADNVDPGDLQAVEVALTACVVGDTRILSTIDTTGRTV